MNTNRFVRSVLGLGLLAATSLLGACASSRTVPLDGSYMGGAQPVMYDQGQGQGAPAPVAYVPMNPGMPQQPMPPQGGPVLQPAPAPSAPQQSFAPPVQQAQPQQFAAPGQMTRGQRGQQVCAQHVLQEASIDAQNSGDQATYDKIGRISGGVIGGTVLGLTQKGNTLTNVGAGAGLGMLAGDVFTGAGQLIGGANKNAAMSDAFNAARAGNAGLVDDEPVAYYPGDDGRVRKVFWGGTGIMEVPVIKP